MMFSWKAIVLASTLVGIVAYCYTIPVPEDCSEPWRLKIMFAFYNLVQSIIDLLDKLGVQPYHLGFRGFLKFTTFIDSLTSSSDLEVKVTVFDGVKVRVYTPKEKKEGPRKAVVYYHGGGFTIGSVESYHEITSTIARQTNVVLVSVEYRLAPEHVFPAAFKDCVKATKYFISNAASFGANPKRVALIGDSAGGNLVATVSIQLRNEKFSPMPKLLLPIYPVVQFLDISTPSIMKYEHETIIHRRAMAQFNNWIILGNQKHLEALEKETFAPKEVLDNYRKSYLNYKNLPASSFPNGYSEPKFKGENKEAWDDLKLAVLDWRLSPLFADDLSNLPRTHIYIAENDVLRDDCWFYVKRLEEAGNDLTFFHHKQSFHGLLNMFKFFKDGRDMMSHIAAVVKENL